MCLVIDPCSLASVFNPKSQKYSEFLPVLRWITRSSGRIIYGGRKYRVELTKMTRYFRIINELDRAGKVVKLNNSAVDKIAAELKAQVPDVQFNDEHIVAIVIVSRCKVVCSDDKESYPYIRRADLYPKGMKRPKIYRSKSHNQMCCKHNIVAACE